MTEARTHARSLPRRSCRVGSWTHFGVSKPFLWWHAWWLQIMKQISFLISLLHVSGFSAVRGSDALTHILKRSSLDLQDVPLYAELDTSETNFLICEVLSRMSTCGRHLTWRNRKNFTARRNETERVTGPIILVATGGPSDEEQKYFKEAHSQGQQWIVLLHPSDEFLTQTDPSMYGDGVTQVFRNYYHGGMGDKSLEYLRESGKRHVPRVLWMPLGLANLKALPATFKFEFIKRPYLWAWAGDTAGKPERAEMVRALNEHASTAQVPACRPNHTTCRCWGDLMSCTLNASYEGTCMMRDSKLHPRRHNTIIPSRPAPLMRNLLRQSK